jgi:hypothetical protein
MKFFGEFFAFCKKIKFLEVIILGPCHIVAVNVSVFKLSVSLDDPCP